MVEHMILRDEDVGRIGQYVVHSSEGKTLSDIAGSGGYGFGEEVKTSSVYKLRTRSEGGSCAFSPLRATIGWCSRQRSRSHRDQGPGTSIRPLVPVRRRASIDNPLSRWDHGRTITYSFFQQQCYNTRRLTLPPGPAAIRVTSRIPGGSRTCFGPWETVDEASVTILSPGLLRHSHRSGGILCRPSWRYVCTVSRRMLTAYFETLRSASATALGSSTPSSSIRRVHFGTVRPPSPTPLPCCASARNEQGETPGRRPPEGAGSCYSRSSTNWACHGTG